MFSLIRFAQLNFRGRSPPHLVAKVPTPVREGAKVKSGACKTRSLLAWRYVFGGNPSISTNYHDSVKKKKKVRWLNGGVKKSG